MMIDIRGTNTVNKGAQLMLEATVERLSPHFKLSTVPIQSDYEVRSSLGLHQTLHVYGKPRLSRALGDRVPGKVARWYGLTRDRDINGVVDAAGFAYSDTFGRQRVERELHLARQWSARGLPYIFLPQAFGPFRDSPTKKAAKELFELADLIFVRDPVSAAYLEELNLSKKAVLSPDFTIGLAPVPTARVHNHSYLAIVPNSKMVTTGTADESDYLSQLTAFGERARKEHDIDPVIVIHESGDHSLGKRLSELLQAPLIFRESPRELKGILGQAQAIVASRFHAVVGGLSQTIPTLAYGWSHKYRELLADFGVQEWLVDDKITSLDLFDSVLTDVAAHERMAQRRSELVKQVDVMWESVYKQLNASSTRSG